MSKIKWTLNNIIKTNDTQIHNMSLEEMNKAICFHRSFPQYAETPLTRLQCLADYLGLKRLYVKDESYRFNFNAFKVLGGSYAIANYIAKQLGKDISELPYNILTSDELRNEFGQATFFTATDGNHGRGVAWAANKLGQKCVVRMPKGTTQTRLKNIAKENAIVTSGRLSLLFCSSSGWKLCKCNGRYVHDHAIMTKPEYTDLKMALHLNSDSEVLLVSTEGDTDPIRYREIIWEGLCGTDKNPFIN